MDSDVSQGSFVMMADKVGLWVENISGAFCVLIYTAVTADVLLGVFFRYIMKNPFEWTEELARYFMVGLGLLAINLATRRKENIRINLVVRRFPSSIARVLSYVVDLLSALFYTILIWQGYLMAKHTMLTGQSINISMSWPYSVVCVGGSLALIQLVIEDIKKVALVFNASIGENSLP